VPGTTGCTHDGKIGSLSERSMYIVFRYIAKRVCGSRPLSESTGGSGGDGQSSEAYEPDSSVRYDDGVVA
jgi:hypothetical protein